MSNWFGTDSLEAYPLDFFEEPTSPGLVTHDAALYSVDPDLSPEHWAAAAEEWDVQTDPIPTPVVYGSERAITEEILSPSGQVCLGPNEFLEQAKSSKTPAEWYDFVDGPTRSGTE